MIKEAGWKQCCIIMCLQQAPRFIWNMKIPAAKPLADLPRNAVTCPNMVHSPSDLSALDFVLNRPHSSPIPPRMTNASSSVSYVQSTPWGIQMALSPACMTAGLFHCHGMTLSFCLLPVHFQTRSDAKLFFCCHPVHKVGKIIHENLGATVSTLVFWMHLALILL